MVLFWASFLTLVAGGIGFAVRAGLLGAWGQQFALTQFKLGLIAGAGLWGFPIAIIPLSFIVDRVGYGRVMVLAFLLHVLSAVVTLLATPVYAAYGSDAAFYTLYWGTFIFSLANGACEAVINPLTATLFPAQDALAEHPARRLARRSDPGRPDRPRLQRPRPRRRPDPLGIPDGDVPHPDGHLWRHDVGPHLPALRGQGGRRAVPRHDPGVRRAVLLLLILLQAMVGYVELGTDSWITNIEGTILESKDYGLMLFVWTSGLMFILRFFAGPIVHRISPLGLLFCSAVLGCCGLLLLGLGPNFMWFCILAVTVYGFGKTFFWPTMLGVVAERFPKGGALTLGVVGGVGMLSVGFLGAPIIGYEQDYFAMQSLSSQSPEAYGRYSAQSPDAYLFLPPVAGLDNTKVGTLLGDPGENNGNGKKLDADIANLKKAGKDPETDKNLAPLINWWRGPVGAKGCARSRAPKKSRAAARASSPPTATRKRTPNPSPTPAFTAAKWR